MTDDQITRTARDLSALIDLSAALEAQAIAKANDRDHLPGGAAMVALGPVASHEAWVNTFDTAERLGRDTSYISDDDEDWAPPLQLLLFWSEAIRLEQGQDYGQRPTIQSEASYLKFALDHLWATEPRFEDFAKDVATARGRLENLLYAGERVQLTRVPCDHSHCEDKPRLFRVFGKTAVEDRYKCRSCGCKFDQAEYEDAYATQLRSEGADKFVPLRDAIGALGALGRGERTIRRWLAPPVKHTHDKCVQCQFRRRRSWKQDCPKCGMPLTPDLVINGEDVVQAYCDTRTKRVYVWWPDLRKRHNAARSKRAA